MLNLIKSHVFTVHSIKCYLQDLQAAARLSLAETETTRQYNIWDIIYIRIYYIIHIQWYKYILVESKFGTSAVACVI